MLSFFIFQTIHIPNKTKKNSVIFFLKIEVVLVLNLIVQVLSCVSTRDVEPENQMQIEYWHNEIKVIFSIIRDCGKIDKRMFVSMSDQINPACVYL